MLTKVHIKVSMKGGGCQKYPKIWPRGLWMPLTVMSTDNQCGFYCEHPDGHYYTIGITNRNVKF